MKPPGRSPRVFHPFLFALFPVLFLFYFNAQQVSMRAFWQSIAAVLAATCLLWGLLSLLVHDRRRSAAVTSLLLVLFFSYGHAMNVLQGTTLWFFQVQGHKNLLALWAAIFLLGILRLSRLKNLDRLTMLLNSISLLLSAWAAVAGCTEYLKVRSGHVEISDLDPAESRGISSSPDIYYIILDGYGRADVLQRYYGYDNAPFVEWLRGKGFYVATEAKANYLLTLFSLSSAFGMGYLDTIAAQLGPASKNTLPFQRLIRDGPVIHYLKKRGYLTAAFSSGIFWTELRNADVYLEPLLVPSNFQNELLSTTLVRAIVRAFDFQSEYHRKRIRYALHQLPRTTRLRSPTFVFAHILCPHPPFVFDRAGRARRLRRNFLFWDAKSLEGETRENYRDQLIFLTGQVQTALEGILNNTRSPAVIILQSDHGPGFFSSPNNSPDYLRERVPILSAYYFPDRDYSHLYPGISPANTFRVIFNQYLGTQLPLLENRTYQAGPKGWYDFHEVILPEERSHD